MDSILQKAAVMRAQASLNENKILGQIKILSDSARSSAEAAKGLGIEVGQIASSIVFKLPDLRSLLVITSGRHRVDIELVATLLEVSMLTRADADYVKEVSGYSVGGVAPIGWINKPGITLIDQVLDEYEVIWAAAGHPYAVFPTTYQELLKASGAHSAKVGD